jgi:hypothetical protein
MVAGKPADVGTFLGPTLPAETLLRLLYLRHKKAWLGRAVSRTKSCDERDA